MDRYVLNAIKYDSFKKSVMALELDDDEKKRVEEEFSLFESRGWESYIPLISKILGGVRDDDSLFSEVCSIGGSAYDSYALRKLNTPDNDIKGMLSNKKGRDILFNDTLRLNFALHYPHNDFTISNLIKLVRIIERSMGGQYCTEMFSKRIRPGKDEDYLSLINEETLIVSPFPIPRGELSLISYETKDSDTEEAEILRKYLLIKIRTVFYK